ncbi:anaerobic sulfatase maturase [Clostridium sp. DL1XJH146]
MKNISFLMKPASGKCNLRCKYCFYNDEMEKREIKDYGMMSIETAQNIIDKAINFAEGGYITFAFQGGEPAVRGMEFFRNFVSYVNEKNTNNSKVNYAIQTNGMLIDKNWAVFLKENKFLVGISLDGTKDINDFNRVDAKGEGSFKKIIKTTEILDKHNVDFNILSVVSRANAKKILKIYNFFKKQGFKYLQFIPCLEPLDEEFGQTEYALTVGDYELFLKNLFNLWYRDIMNGEFVSIRYFDNLLSMYMGYEPEACDMRGRCSIQNVVEGDGSVYPCDFYVIDKYKLGNINENSIDEIINSEVGKRFIEGSFKLSDDCKKCKWKSICRGGCRRYRELNDEVYKNYYCKAFYNFYEYSYGKFIEIAQGVKMGRIRL